ncbi:MAG: sel1 repeat family protein [Betaproteobacteria bacterium]|nr:sel1 repeat family protein [Betaproteobacteria bacterium]
MDSKREITQLPVTPEIRYRVALDEYDRGHHKESLRLACALIDQGFNHANALAGAIYEDGRHGVNEDFEKARFYFERAVETVGSVEGWLGLGRMYFFGKGVPKDLELAAKYYEAVDEDTDSAVAQLMLGRIYGDALGPLYNPEKAREYLRRSAQNGNVFASTYWALLERNQGNWFLGGWLRLRAATLALLISKRDPTDPRLRQC